MTEQPGTPSKSEQRNAAIRASIRPLAPGERPRTLKIAVAVCVLLAAGNVAVALSAQQIAGARPVAPAIVLALFLVLIGYGMWQRSATAVLIFLGLLVLSILAAFLAILVAANLKALVASGAILAAAGILFWKLISVLARIQAPSADGNEVPAREDGHR